METPYRYYDVDKDCFCNMDAREILAYNHMIQQPVESLAQEIIRHRRKHPDCYNWGTVEEAEELDIQLEIDVKKRMEV